VADDPTYQAQLSDASKVTLDQQGGPFSADQSAAFLARPFSSEAVALRRFDDAGKDPDHVVPDLDHFLPLVEEVLTSARWMPAGPPQTASSATDRDSDSAPAALSGAWVRDACRCPKCRDSGNDQHLVDVCDLVDRDGRSHWRVLTVDQSCDPSVIEVEHQATGELHRCLVPRRAWRPASKSKPAAVDGKSWNGDHVRARDRWTTSFDSSKWVDEVSGNTARFGLARLTGVPCTSGMVLEVAGQLGYVRVTNYGDLFEVRTEPNPENLAYTTLGLPLHTDNPYREPCPGVQLLHCLQPSAEGGASLLADGFAAAELLRDVDGTAFDLLASTPVRFRFHRDQPGVEKVDLQTVRTIVELDADRRLRAVNVNHRSMEVPTPTPGVDAFYSAYRRLVGILSSPEFMIEVALEAGDLIVFDNRRVLHGRTGFASSSPRHLQGCYIDMDAVRSRARTAGPT